MLPNAPEVLHACNNAQGIKNKMDAKKETTFLLHSVQDGLGSMVWRGACNNAQGAKNHAIAKEGSNAMVDKKEGVTNNGIKMLEAGELEKKKQSDAVVLHNAPDAAHKVVGKDACNNALSIKKKMGAKEGITSALQNQEPWDENWVRGRTAPERHVSFSSDNFGCYLISKAWKMKDKMQ